MPLKKKKRGQPSLVAIVEFLVRPNLASFYADVLHVVPGMCGADGVANVISLLLSANPGLCSSSQETCGNYSVPNWLRVSAVDGEAFRDASSGPARLPTIDPQHYRFYRRKAAVVTEGQLGISEERVMNQRFCSNSASQNLFASTDEIALAATAVAIAPKDAEGTLFLIEKAKSLAMTVGVLPAVESTLDANPVMNPCIDTSCIHSFFASHECCDPTEDLWAFCIEAETRDTESLFAARINSGSSKDIPVADFINNTQQDAKILSAEKKVAARNARLMNAPIVLLCSLSREFLEIEKVVLEETLERRAFEDLLRRSWCLLLDYNVLWKGRSRAREEFRVKNGRVQEIFFEFEKKNRISIEEVESKKRSVFSQMFSKAFQGFEYSMLKQQLLLRRLRCKLNSDVASRS